jgi:hypothetical protein
MKGDMEAIHWMAALSHMMSSELDLRLCYAPARGTPWTPEQKRQWLRLWLTTNVWHHVAPVEQ